MEDAIAKEVMELGGDIVASWRFAKARSVPHHSKRRNIALHSLETAGYALQIARWLNQHGVSVNERDAVRASLLHDIGMTEDEVYLSPSRVKAHTHPREGARIAREEYGATEVQWHAVASHMWPVSGALPRTVEGWVVTAADKCCSIHEVGCHRDEIVELAARRLLRLWNRIRR